MEDQSRFEAMKELDEVRRARTVTMQDDEVRSEVAKVILLTEFFGNKYKFPLDCRKSIMSRYSKSNKY